MPVPDWWWIAWYANPDRRKEMIRDHLLGPLVAMVVLVPVLLAVL